MELTKSQISELFSTFLSSGDCFNTLVDSLLDAVESTSKCRAALLFDTTPISVFQS